MRLATVIAVLGLFLVSPAHAQSGHSFGSTICPQSFPCPNSAQSEPDYVTLANTCVTQQFGFHSDKGFFNDIAGLGTNSCMTPLDGVIPKGMGAQLTAQCCVQPINDTTCTFHCTLTSN